MYCLLYTFFYANRNHYFPHYPTMLDLTPLFSRCVAIVETELGNSSPQTQKVAQKNQDPHTYVLTDTFIKECHEMYENLVKMNGFLAQIRPTYLAISDDFSNHGKSRNTLSHGDKNTIDEEFKFKLQELYQKLKHLQAYEAKRAEVSASQGHGSLFSTYFGAEDDEKELFNSTISRHRTQILRSLNNTANSTNKRFEVMQRKRVERERQLSLLNFQDLEDDDLNDVLELQTYDTNFGQEPVSEETEAPVLSQELVQELEVENKAFLALKTTQLKQVENLHTSMVDIVNLQAELTFQLETQGEQISNLLENQAQVEIDLRMGNQNLTKATDRNKKGSNMIITGCLVLGCLLLFIDYVS